jgi:flavin-dependent thymidylate synthase
MPLMRVDLLSTTPHALELLIFTKNTRLRMSAVGLADILAWPEDKKQTELRYMRNTIQSSWEFVDYVFLISDVTRAFTHQLVRHRVGTSFAQQAQRAVDMSDFDYVATGPKLNPEPGHENSQHNTQEQHDARYGLVNLAPAMYATTMQQINRGYRGLIGAGVAAQDARGVLPTNICTNIVFKANLRTLHDMALKRLCVKAQGEFQDVFRAMVSAVVAVHPWAADFLKVQCAWNGTCLFPTLPITDCHVKGHVYDPTTGRAYDGGTPATNAEIDALFQLERREIQPQVPA